MLNLKKFLREKLPKNRFVRNASVLISGTLAAQVALILASPLLTRLYTPEDFGLLAVYMSMLAIFLLLSSLRYDIAIPLPEEDSEATSIAALSLILVVLIFSFVAIFVLIFRMPLAEFLGMPIMAAYFWLLPLGILFGGFYNVFSRWSVRSKKFSLIASTNIRKAFALIAVQVACFKLGGLGLMLGQVTSHGTGVFRLARPNFSNVSLKEIKRIAKRYRRFPIFSAPAGLSRVVGAELPSLVLAAAFNPAAAGLYALTKRVCGVPSSVIGGAVSQVFVANAPESYRNGTLGPLVRDFHSRMAYIGLPFTLLLMILGPELFSFVFGVDWRQAGEFARWLAPWLYLGFISSPLTNITAVMERQKQGLFFHLALLAIRILALSIGVWMQDVLLTIIIFSLVNAIWRLVFLMWLYVISGNKISTFLLDSFSALSIACLTVSPVFISHLFLDNYNFFSLAISLVFILILYWKLLKQAY